MSYTVLEVNLGAILSCRDNNNVLGLKIFNPFRRHYKTHITVSVKTECLPAFMTFSEAAWQVCLNLSTEIQAVRRNY